MESAPRDQSLLNMICSPSAKNKISNYSSSDVDEAIKEIQTGEMAQVKAVREYGILFQTLVQKCKNKIENVEKRSPGLIPVPGEVADKDLVKWALAMQKQGLLLGWDMIIHKASEIHRQMFGSMRSVGSVVRGWC